MTVGVIDIKEKICVSKIYHFIRNDNVFVTHMKRICSRQKIWLNERRTEARREAARRVTEYLTNEGSDKDIIRHHMDDLDTNNVFSEIGKMFLETRDDRIPDNITWDRVPKKTSNLFELGEGD